MQARRCVGTEAPGARKREEISGASPHSASSRQSRPCGLKKSTLTAAHNKRYGHAMAPSPPVECMHANTCPCSLRCSGGGQAPRQPLPGVPSPLPSPKCHPARPNNVPKVSPKQALAPCRHLLKPRMQPRGRAEGAAHSARGPNLLFILRMIVFCFGLHPPGCSSSALGTLKLT